jgi:polysaccharide biosynthesis transport protein
MQMQPPTALTRPSCAPRVAIESFFRRKRLFLWTVVTILLVTTAITLLLPRQYASVTKFLIQNTRGNVVVTPERTNSASAPNDVTDTQVNSEMEILHSHDVVDSIADPEWAATTVQQQTPARIKRHEKLLADFEKRFRTEAVLRTNIINVTVFADTPQKAKNELERLSAAYVAERRRLQRPGGTSHFFALEAERIRNEWDVASGKLVNFQQQHQLLSLSNREAVLQTWIQDHERDMFATDATLKEMDAKLSTSAERLKELPMRQTTEEKVLANPESLGHLNTLLVELVNRRTALLTNYKADDRTVRELDQQIATTTAALNDATRMAGREETTDVDPAWQQLHKEFLETGVGRQQALAHRASLTAEMDIRRQQLVNLQGLTTQFDNLEAQANRLKESYDLYAQKRDQAQIEDAMDEEKFLNVTVAQAPTLSYEVARPQRLMNILAGLAAALFTGFCLLYLSEISRSTIATPREFDRSSRHPLLATIPKISLWVESVIERQRFGKGHTLALNQPPPRPVLTDGQATNAMSQEQSQTDITALSVREKAELQQAQLPNKYEGLLFRIMTQLEQAHSRGYVVMLTSPTRGAGVSRTTNSLADLLNRGGGQAAVALNCRHLDQHNQGIVTSATDQNTATDKSSASEEAQPVGGSVHSVRDSFVVSLERLRSEYRYILVDCPSMNEAQDAVLLAPLVDGIVMVVEADRTRVEQLSHAEKTLELAKGKILGHVLNKRAYVVPDWLCRKMEAVGI